MINDPDKLTSILRKGDVVLTHGDSLISKTIRAVTRSYWNHAVLYAGDRRIVEADWSGVVISDIKKYMDKEIVVLRHRLASEGELETMVNHSIEEHLGE